MRLNLKGSTAAASRPFDFVVKRSGGSALV